MKKQDPPEESMTELNLLKRKSLSKPINIAASTIIILTVMMIWIVFLSPKDDVTDPNPFIANLPQTVLSFLASPLFLIVVICLLIYFAYDPLFYILFGKFLNQCSFCDSLRSESPPYLVNGFCGSCNTNICSKCFNYVNKKKKKPIGCPICGSTRFIHKKRIGYIRAPNIMKKLQRNK